MRQRELLKKGTELLARAGIEEAAADAWLLFSYERAANRNWYYLHMEEEALPGQEEAYLSLIDARCGRMPVQYITGEQPFMGLVFKVNESVLIPRLDTEILVEECERHLRPGMRILDMCTGSGCILISLLYRFERERGGGPGPRTEEACPAVSGISRGSGGIEGTGVDISSEALEVARRNAEENGVRAAFVQSDLFEKVEGTFDLIVSNPPYIASGDIASLMPEVREFEPVLALDGSGDGLDFYRRIVREAGKYLAEGGWLCFEIGCDQGAAVSEMMNMYGYHNVQVIKDLSGHDRVVAGNMQEG